MNQRNRTAEARFYNKARFYILILLYNFVRLLSLFIRINEQIQGERPFRGFGDGFFNHLCFLRPDKPVLCTELHF